MNRLPPRSTRPDTLFPYSTLSRSQDQRLGRAVRETHDLGRLAVRPAVTEAQGERGTLLRGQAGEQPIRVDRGVAATMRRVGRRRLVPLRQPFAPPRGAPLVEEDPPADPHDPGGIAALSPVVAGALPGADEGLLRQIVGIAARDRKSTRLNSSH